MKEPVAVSVSIQTDTDTRKSLAVSEQERQEPLPVSILVGYSVQTFTKYGKFESVLCERYNYTHKPFETHTAAL